ncbi:hypothetical protein [Kitasatospora sp. A2-31]|uniref:hypothetical protein n=1 Tax=Kitasatospora sp. A2-31 TaxID=2916414 RepID=UPI001EEA4014|nr:hypothetical protein [Kitasatospora sp. A2-31]MCG6496953.1 hypothetical protein [Kitasatospora sp. A2-31]
MSPRPRPVASARLRPVLPPAGPILGDHLASKPTHHAQQALQLLAPPGTVRVLLAVNYHEDPGARAAGPPATDSMDEPEVHRHLRRLQDARLLAHTGDYDISRQSTTTAARELWPVWLSALRVSYAAAPELAQDHVGITVERALEIAGHPAVLDAVSTMQRLPVPLRGASHGVARLLDTLSRTKRDGEEPSNRISVEFLGHLSDLHTALGDWHRTYFPADRVSASTARSLSPATTEHPLPPASSSPAPGTAQSRRTGR